MKLNILGTSYSVTITNDGKEPRLKNCDGFCDDTTHEIVAEDYKNKVGDDPDAKRNLKLQTQKIIRHEIIHAFLFESGLAENSPWAQDEEMVDWIAKQAPRLIDAWQKAGAL